MKGLLILFSCVFVVNFGQATDCPDRHVQSKYCDADFVLKATVKSLSNETDPAWKSYYVNIKSQIKIDKRFMLLDDSALKKIYVGNNFDYPWQFGEKYVLSGHVRQVGGVDALVVEQCDWIELWSQIGHRHRASLRKSKFDKGCKCTIEMSLYDSENTHECRPHLRDSVIPALSATQRSELNNCFLNHSHCLSKSLNHAEFKCVWSWNRELKHCLKEAGLPIKRKDDF